MRTQQSKTLLEMVFPMRSVSRLYKEDGERFQFAVSAPDSSPLSGVKDSINMPLDLVFL